MSSAYTKIYGGKTLSGEVQIGGSKNASLQLLAAALLTEDTCILRNIPDLTDVAFMTKIIEDLGAKIERIDRHVWKIFAQKLQFEVNQHAMRFRASVCLMGAVLSRVGKVAIPLPGGCNLGERPIDLHLKAFEKLGASVQCYKDRVEVSVNEKLRGAEFSIEGPRGATVTGTANAVMAAVLAEGQTRLIGAARDPEVQDLCNMLVLMGAKIDGIGSSILTIEGVAELHGVEYTVQPDRIEAGTFIVLGLMCGDMLRFYKINTNHLRNVLDIFDSQKCFLKEEQDAVIVSRSPDLIPMDLVAEQHPGFPTDMQSQMAVLCTQIAGVSRIKDIIFPQRFAYASELQKMGAKITGKNGEIEICGKSLLKGAEVKSTDLRAGASMFLAGLVAEGETIVTNLEHVDRGYEDFEAKLCQIGAQVTRVNL